MTGFRNLPIKHKLLLIVVVSTLVALGLAGGAMLAFQWSAARVRLVQDLTTQARMLGDNCAAAIVFHDPRAAREILGSVRARAEIVRVVVAEPDGREFARFENGTLPDLPAVPAEGVVFGDDYCLLQQPVELQGDVVGSILLVLDLHDYRRRLLVYLAIGVGTSLVALVVALVVTTRLQRVFTGPLGALARGAAAVTQRNDYTVRVVAEAEDEIGQLTGAFNEMLAQIQRRDDVVRSAEERLRLLVECLPVITYTAEPTPQGRWYYISPQVEQMLGFTPAEWLARPGLWLNRVHPDDRDKVIAADERCRATGIFQADYRLLARDGRVVWCRDEGVLQRGQPAVIQGVILDVTERQRTIEALRQSEERLQSIIDNSTAVIYLKDRAGHYLLINRLFETVFGVTRAAAVGQCDHDLFPPDIAEAFRANDLKVLVEGRPLQFDEVAPHADGPHTYISLKFPILNNGRVEALCGISTDVTERRRLERQVLEISDREQARIGQDLHDGLCQHLIGTAFACRLLGDKLAEQGAPTAAEARTVYTLINDAISQARQIARGLYPVKLKAEGLAIALEELAGNVRHLFKISCQVLIPQEPVLQNTATSIHLYRIAQEAVTNATKHGHVGHISIACKVTGARVTLTVTDDGTGLPADFDRRRGLGLHIMNYRAALIGGILTVRNAPAGGTIIECSFESHG